METSDVTPVILTYNEAENLEKLLPLLIWAGNVVILDSGSTDGTADIASRFSNVAWHELPFVDHATQWSAAITLASQHSEWILRLDADYELPDDFLDELAQLTPDVKTDGYWAEFDFVVHSKSLRYSMFPGNLVLFRHSSVEIEQDGHTERIQPRGEIGTWEGRFRHHDMKSIGRFAQSQIRYASLEAQKLAEQGESGWKDRLRKTALVPLLVPVWLLLARGLILDGRAGLHYTLQRTVAETMIALAYVDLRLRR